MNEQILAHKSIAPQPEHIPDSVVYDFDMFYDSALMQGPHQRMLDLLDNAPPIFWTPRNGGHWVLLTHEANFNAARDTETFSSEQVPQEEVNRILALMPPDFPRIPQPFPVNLDPPMHAKYRVPLQRVFSPKMIDKFQTDIRALTVKMIEQIADRGHCEFMEEVGEPLPVTVFLKIFGLPLERMTEYRLLVKTLFNSLNSGDQSDSVPYLIQIVASIRETLLERRDNPRDDLISLLWKLEIEGKPTTLEVVENYGLVLFLAGLDTVMNAMGLGVCHLARDQALQTELRNNPSLIRDATEELLRRYSFVIPRRRVTKDGVFQGVAMKKGEQVLLCLATANLDSRRFPEAEKFDLNRESKAHIVFSAGPHRCLGSHLARIELQILYEEMLARLPQFELAPDKLPVYHGGPVFGPNTLHLVWEK